MRERFFRLLLLLTAALTLDVSACAAEYLPASFTGSEASLSFDAAVVEERPLVIVRNPAGDWEEPDSRNELTVRLVTVKPGSQAVVTVSNSFSGEVSDSVRAGAMVPDGEGHYYAAGSPSEEGVMEFLYPTLKSGSVDEWFQGAAEGTLYHVTIRDDRAAYESVYIAYGAESPAGDTSRFTDIPEGAYYTAAVSWALDKGVTNGTTPTTFSPGSTTNRGQVAAFLWRASGSPEPETKTNPFTDVKEDSAFYKAILWAYENEITLGTTATTFSPANPCTRAHVLTFLWRSQGKPAAEWSTLADQYPGRFFTDALAWADRSGLLGGTGPEYIGGSVFTPTAPCPRADIVTYLYRTLS